MLLTSLIYMLGSTKESYRVLYTCWALHKSPKELHNQVRYRGLVCRALYHSYVLVCRALYDSYVEPCIRRHAPSPIYTGTKKIYPKHTDMWTRL